MNKLKACLPEIQNSWQHHRCMVEYHDLKGRAGKRPTEASPLDSNAPPECDRTALDRHRHSIHCIYVLEFFFFHCLVRFWCNFLFKPLEYFVVFSFMHRHLLQVCLCQGCRGKKKKKSNLRQANHV